MKGPIYIAGKMREVPLYNFPAFDAAQACLELQGWTVISPAQMDRERGFDPSTEATPEFLEEAMERDVLAIIHLANALALLPGWESSTGANGEMWLARWKRIPVYLFPSMVELGKEDVLEEAMRITSHDRQGQYGHPRDHFSRTVAALNARFRTGKEPLFAREMTPQEWPLMVAIDKLCGRGEDTRDLPRDTLVDVPGYCRTTDMARRLPICDAPH
jgi:hypothetical protein